MDLYLIMHNVGFIASAVAGVGVFCFLLLNKPRSRGSILFSLFIVAAIVFLVSHVIGTNISDPDLSRKVLMLNISVIFIGMFHLHAIIAAIGTERKHYIPLVLIYLLGFGMAGYFIINPEMFLVQSVPKMYFPNYYEPGPLNWLRTLYLYGICVTYMVSVSFLTYYRAKETKQRKQWKYITIGLVFAYATGYIPNFLIDDIEINPLWGMACLTLFIAPLLYAAIKYELMGIKIIAKQALIYSIAVGVVGGLIALLDYMSRFVESAYQGFPIWLIPLISGVVVVSIAAVVWRQLREGDLLKYEFITIVTHKFRTPLTHIKWASENLIASNLPTENRTQVEYIQTANAKLVELTNVLANASEAENSYEYRPKQMEFAPLIEEALGSLNDQISSKRIQITRAIEPGIQAFVDAGRIRFVIQTLLENAVNYTPENGTVFISVRADGSQAVCEVKDSGIGIPKDEMQYLFSKFYRGDKAQHTDTEGLGIGLFMCKEILSKHKGKIWAESEGTGKGSSFLFSVPLTGHN